MEQTNALALSCPLPIAEYPNVLLAHGGGGTLMHQLIERMIVPAFANPLLGARHDGAVLDLGGVRLAFTTDSYVVHPLFFPGGDIGSLAVNGTVNDLAMCGARPRYLSAGLIIEEGLPLASELARCAEAELLLIEAVPPLLEAYPGMRPLGRPLPNGVRAAVAGRASDGPAQSGGPGSSATTPIDSKVITAGT